MEQSLDINRLLGLRKVTRAITAVMEKELKANLAVLSPLIQPKLVFGAHLPGGAKKPSRSESESLEQLRGIYSSLANANPYNLPKEVESPLDIVSTSPQLFSAEFRYLAKSGEDSRDIVITPPLKWVLSYAGFGPQRLRDLIARQKTTVGNDLQQCVLHSLVMHVTLARRPEVVRLFESLRCPITTGYLPQFGKLPITYVECAVPAFRPPDEIIIQSTEISGTPAFEEVVSVEGIMDLGDPLKKRLIDLIQEHGSDLLPRS